MILRKKSYITHNTGNKKKSKFKILRNRTIKNKYNLTRKKKYKKGGSSVVGRYFKPKGAKLVASAFNKLNT